MFCRQAIREEVIKRTREGSTSGPRNTRERGEAFAAHSTRPGVFLVTTAAILRREARACGEIEYTHSKDGACGVYDLIAFLQLDWYRRTSLLVLRRSRVYLVGVIGRHDVIVVDMGLRQDRCWKVMVLGRRKTEVLSQHFTETQQYVISNSPV